MIGVERLFLFVSIIICAASMILHIIGWVFEKNLISKTGRWLLWAFWCSITVTIAVRWQYQGHGPYITMYEVFLSNVWVATGFYLLFSLRKKELEKIGVFVVPILFLSIGGVVMSPAQVSNLTPSYRSVWLILHVLFAKLTYGTIVIATSLAISVLLRNHLDSRNNRLIKLLTDPRQADILCYKLIACSLFFASIMIISGSIWANQLWGKYWGWDPIEVWSLVTWLVYGIYLHLRITYKFSGTPAAIYVVCGFLATIFSFFIMPYVLPTVHNSFMFAK